MKSKFLENTLKFFKWVFLEGQFFMNKLEI